MVSYLCISFRYISTLILWLLFVVLIRDLIFDSLGIGKYLL